MESFSTPCGQSLCSVAPARKRLHSRLHSPQPQHTNLLLLPPPPPPPCHRGHTHAPLIPLKQLQRSACRSAIQQWRMCGRAMRVTLVVVLCPMHQSEPACVHPRACVCASSCLCVCISLSVSVCLCLSLSVRPSVCLSLSVSVVCLARPLPRCPPPPLLPSRQGVCVFGGGG